MRDSLLDSLTREAGGDLRPPKPAPSQQIKHPIALTGNPEAGWEIEVQGLALRTRTKVHPQNPQVPPH